MSLIPVPRVISAAGFVTSLGGGSLSETVRAAMDEAAGEHVASRRPADVGGRDDRRARRAPRPGG